LLHFEKVSIQLGVDMVRSKLSFDPAISHPCQERWAEMEGNLQQRHCQSCNKQVYNLAAMSCREIEHLVQAKGSELCARITRRGDGSLITLDPISRPSVAAQIAVSVSLVLGSAMAMGQSDGDRPNGTEAVLVGTVLSSDGSGPIEGARISLSASSVVMAETRSNEQGGFRLSVSPGMYDIEIKKGPKDGMQFHKVDLREGELNLSSFSSGTTVSVDAYAAGETSTLMGTMSATITHYTLSYILRHPIVYARHLMRKL
jgi:Carboxypeptidase regulatory-like domain